MGSLPPLILNTSVGAPTDVFVYGSKSAHVAPGLGKNEALTSSAELYAPLSAIRNWRRVLSQFHQEEFVYDGHTFATAEHAWHYAKLQAVDQAALAQEFAIESNSPLSRESPQKAKSAGGKNGIYRMSKSEIARWEAVLTERIADVLYAKFSQSPVARKVLIATRDATLFHLLSRVARGRNLQPVPWLEKVRARIVAETTLSPSPETTESDAPMT